MTSRERCFFRFILSPGREHNLLSFNLSLEFFSLNGRNLPEGSEADGDSAYLDDEFQDKLKEVEKVRLIVEQELSE